MVPGLPVLACKTLEDNLLTQCLLIQCVLLVSQLLQ